MYSESERPWFYHLLVTIVGVSLMGSVWFFNFLDVSERGTTVVIVFCLAFSFPIISFLVMSWAFSRYFIQFDGNDLSFGYQGWNVKLSHSEIISAKTVDIKWIRWGGMGWRLRGLRKIGYIVKSGSGVEISTHRKGRMYTFNCSDPEQLVKELDKG